MPPSDTANSSSTKPSVFARMCSVSFDEGLLQSRPIHKSPTANRDGKITAVSSPEQDRRNLLDRNRHDHHPSRHIPATKDITMWRHPIYTMKYFGMAVCDAFPKQLPWSLQSTSALLVSLAIILFLHDEGKRGTFNTSDSTSIQEICRWIQNAALETLFWIGCGVLSTIGLGSGVQTGALFLFPHVCRLSLAWSKQQIKSNDAPSLAALLWSVAIPGFFSGTGSALGELVPFLLARVIRKSGKDPFALLHGEIPSASKSFNRADTASTICSTESNDSLSRTDEATIRSIRDPNFSESVSPSWWTPQLLLSNTRVAMESQLSSNVFWKVFTLAVVPNALFDLAGLVCGASSDVSWWEFFLATWSAKALIRTPAQTCGLALAVVAIASPRSLTRSKDVLVQNVHRNSFCGHSTATTAAITDLMERWGRIALAKFVDDEEFHWNQDGENLIQNSTPSVVFDGIKLLWSLITVFLFVFFVVNTIEQIAQHYVRTKPELQKYHECAVETKQVVT